MSDIRSGPPTRAEVCAAALAECFRGDGEILANPIGTLPTIGTPEAREILKLLAEGDRVAKAAEDARAALKRK